MTSFDRGGSRGGAQGVQASFQKLFTKARQYAKTGAGSRHSCHIAGRVSVTPFSPGRLFFAGGLTLNSMAPRSSGGSRCWADSSGVCGSSCSRCACAGTFIGIWASILNYFEKVSLPRIDPEDKGDSDIGVCTRCDIVNKRYITAQNYVKMSQIFRARSRAQFYKHPHGPNHQS